MSHRVPGQDYSRPHAIFDPIGKCDGVFKVGFGMRPEYRLIRLKCWATEGGGCESNCIYEGRVEAIRVGCRKHDCTSPTRVMKVHGELRPLRNEDLKPVRLVFSFGSRERGRRWDSHMLSCVYRYLAALVPRGQAKYFVRSRKFDGHGVSQSKRRLRSTGVRARGCLASGLVASGGNYIDSLTKV